MYFSLFQLLEEEEIDVPVSTVNEPMKEDTKMDTDEVPTISAPTEPTSTGENEANMQDAKEPDDASGAGAENGVAGSGDKPVQMETDAKVAYYNHFFMCYLFV